MECRLSNEMLINAIKTEFCARVTPKQILPHLKFLNPDDEERIINQVTTNDGCLKLIECLKKIGDPRKWLADMRRGLIALRCNDIVDTLRGVLNQPTNTDISSRGGVIAQESSDHVPEDNDRGYLTDDIIEELKNVFPDENQGTNLR